MRCGTSGEPTGGKAVLRRTRGEFGLEPPSLAPRLSDFPYGIDPIDQTVQKPSNNPYSGLEIWGLLMPEGNAEPVIKELCKQIAAEENPGQLEHLVKSLQNTVAVERDETRLRLRWIAQQYRDRISAAPLGPRMLDVIRFLGLIPPRR